MPADLGEAAGRWKLTKRLFSLLTLLVTLFEYCTKWSQNFTGPRTCLWRLTSHLGFWRGARH